MGALTSRPEWAGLKAVQKNKVFIADGNQFFNRPGPRLVESLEILAEMLHPRKFNFGHKGVNWQPYETRPQPPKVKATV
jgi:iron complex transport system substrate-binding protein